MPKVTRVYTRTGDDGTTGLVGGGRIAKNAPVIDLYGTVDELSSAIGLARAAMRSQTAGNARGGRLDAWLAWTQDALFNLGSALATPAEHRSPQTPSVGEADVAALERAIDQAQHDLAPLSQFIHPGGSLAGAGLHLARTICRRAERLAVAQAGHLESLAPNAIRYLNRLSDALFVWARWINDAAEAPEHRWNPTSKPPQP
jgi:cob(I)alamin adenosyltransferase